jgi:hypothetical protein
VVTKIDDRGRQGTAMRAKHPRGPPRSYNAYRTLRSPRPSSTRSLSRWAS